MSDPPPCAPRPSRPSRGRRFAFAALVGVAALVALEVGCRLLGLGAPSPLDDPARGFLPAGALFAERTDAAGERRLDVVETRAALQNRPLVNPQSVPVRRAPGEVRIVCLGGSMTYGWPWDDRSSYPRLLEAGLRAAGAAEVRVVNLGIAGWGTTRLALVADEVAALAPDVVVVVCGNNEALEAAFARDAEAAGRGASGLVAALSRRSRFANAVRRGAAPPQPLSPDALRRHAQVTALTGGSRAEVVERFAANLRRIAGTFTARGARVFLAADPVNERDCPPHCLDAPGDPSGSADPAIVARYAEARRLLAAGESGSVLEILGELRRALPASARTAFLHGRTLLSNGRREEGAAALRAAVDLDAVALRTFGALAAAGERVAAETGAVWIDVPGAVRAAAADGVPGDDLFVDNCHPNEAGTLVVAATVARSLAAAGVVDAARTGGPDLARRFDAGARAHLAAVRRSAADEVVALQWLLGYWRGLNAESARAAEIQRRIETLDPDHAVADDAWRRAFFR